MFCWKCGQEVQDGTRFCTECGAELGQKTAEGQTPPVRPAVVPPEETVSAASRPYEPAGNPAPAASGTYESAPTAQNTPKKKKTGWIVVAIFALLALFGIFNQSKDRSSGGSGSSSSIKDTSDLEELYDTLPAALEDIITLHNVYFSDEGNGLRIFEIVYYGSDTHNLTGLTEEYVFEKSYGYSLDNVMDAGLESDFPSFAECSYSEDDDHVIFTCKMKDLKDVSRLQALVDVGFMSKSDGGSVSGVIDADYYMDSVLALGWEEASPLDYSLLHFD